MPQPWAQHALGLTWPMSEQAVGTLASKARPLSLKP